jgi:hypothetical protein
MKQQIIAASIGEEFSGKLLRTLLRCQSPLVVFGALDAMEKSYHLLDCSVSEEFVPLTMEEPIEK